MRARRINIGKHLLVALAISVFSGCVEVGAKTSQPQAEELPDSGDSSDAEQLSECGQDQELILVADLEEMQGCQNVLADVFLTRALPSNLDTLRPLVRADKSLEILNSDFVLSAEALPNLEFVGGDLSFSTLLQMESLRGLENLRTVEGTLALASIGVTSLEPLSGLVAVGSLFLSDVPGLSSLSELENLAAVRGEVVIEYTGISEAEVRAFAERVEIGGTITYEGRVLEL